MLVNRALLTSQPNTALGWYNGTTALANGLRRRPLVVGLVGSAFRRNTEVTSNPGRWEGDQPAEVQMPPNPPPEAAVS
jgi:hypothetical protein